jgi:acyl-CoA reductase-like NAD-dependent aldehyde dehydrogenase
MSTTPSTETAARTNGSNRDKGQEDSRDLAAVLARMKRAQREHGTPSYDERVQHLDALERAVLQHKDAVVAAVSRDFGNRAKQETLAAEVFVTVSEIRHARSNLRDWMRTEPRDVGLAFIPASAAVTPQPLGVVGVIAPWNYPVQLALAPLVGAIAAGNRVMIKPSELAPESARAIEALVADAFPSDRAVVVTGGPEVAEAFGRLPFDHLLFTGSTRVGKLVMRAAAENLVPVTLELGGKSPAIVGAEISPRSAAEKIMAGKCFNAGQTCVAPDYALVPKGDLGAFVAACEAAVARMYPTLLSNPDYTSIVSDHHHARLARYVAEAKARGARVVEINPAKEALGPEQRKMAPTLVVDPPDDLAVMQDEIFGPILPIKTYDALDGAIDYVNDRPRPLALYFMGHDEAEIERVLARTISGGVCVNDTMLHVGVADLPFGGVGPSGMGHYHGREGFETFSKKKAVMRQARLSGAALLRPPFGRAADLLLKLLIGG